MPFGVVSRNTICLSNEEFAAFIMVLLLGKFKDVI